VVLEGQLKAHRGIAALLAATLCLTAHAATERFTGRVVSVADGDTIGVIRDGYATPVRLDGIDCPESGQPFSQRARRRVAELALRKVAEVRVKTTDVHQRLVARVRVDGVDLSTTLVREGLAWHYLRYSSDPALAAAEAAARAARVGIWSEPNPVAPWDWRYSAPRAPATRSGAAKPQLSEQEKEAAESLGLLHGNTSSRVFHTANCKNYWCARCTQIFSSESEAKAAGYRPAGCCHR
jgi:micrococcal nuclease